MPLGSGRAPVEVVVAEVARSRGRPGTTTTRAGPRRAGPQEQTRQSIGQRSVSTAIVRAILNGAAASGVPSRQLVAESGLPPEATDGRGYVSLCLEEQLWRAAVARSGSPTLGLQAAGALTRGSFRDLEYVVRASETVGDALWRLGHFNQILHGTPVFFVAPRPHGQSITYRSPHPRSEPFAAQAAEFALTAIVVAGRDAAGLDFIPQRITWQHPPPLNLSLHRTLLGCEPCFDAPADELTLDRSLLEHPLPGADPELCSVLEDHLEVLMEAADLPSEFDAVVERAITELLTRHHDASLDRLGEHLGMARRTIQKYLARDGTSYQLLLDRVRERMARSQLRHRQTSVADVAKLLGYSSDRAFHRAFVRWTGAGPAAYRHRMMSATATRTGG